MYTSGLNFALAIPELQDCSVYKYASVTKNGNAMKTFTDYISMMEIAAYTADEAEAKAGGELDPRSQASMDAMKEALKHIMETRPDMLVAFLNLHRTDPDVKRILLKHKLDVFLDPKGKQDPDFKEKGLADEEGEANMVSPNAADGFTS